MKILTFSAQFRQHFGVYLPASNSESDLYLSLLSIFVLISGLQAFLWLSVCYIVIEKKDVELFHVVYSVLQICDTSAEFGPYVLAIFAKEKIGEFIELLEQIVGKRSSETGRLFEYVQRNIKIITELLQGAFDSSKYCDPLRISLPLERTTIMGSTADNVLKIIFTVAYYMAYCCNFTLFMSLCLYLEALCEEFGGLYRYSGNFSAKNRRNTQDLKQHLIEVVNFQTNIDTLFERLKNISSEMLLTNQLASAAIFLAKSACQRFDTHFITMCGAMIVAIFPLSCSLKSSVQILRSSISYYLMIKEL